MLDHLFRKVHACYSGSPNGALLEDFGIATKHIALSGSSTLSLLSLAFCTDLIR